MKPNCHSFPSTRPALLATAFLVAAGLSLSAQTSGSSNGSSSYGSSPTSSSGNADRNSSNSNYNSSTTSGMATDHETNSAGKLSWSDRRFITKAADGNHDEIEIAQLASERASNPDVKQFAQKLIDDHTQLKSQLSSLAMNKNVKLDNDNTKDRTFKRLSNKSGDDFDREFVAHMVDEHEKDIKMFEKEANDAKDADVRSFASQSLDHLREHLQLAQNLQQSVVPTGRESKHSGRVDSSSTDTSTPRK